MPRHEPDLLQVTQTLDLKWPSGPGAPRHTQGQVQPSSKGNSWCFMAATMPVHPLAATSITESCSRCPEWWIPHKQGKALCREGSCVCSPKRTEP